MSDLKTNLGDLDDEDMLFLELDGMTKRYHNLIKRGQYCLDSTERSLMRVKKQNERAEESIEFLKEALDVFNSSLIKNEYFVEMGESITQLNEGKFDDDEFEGKMKSTMLLMQEQLLRHEINTQLDDLSPSKRLDELNLTTNRLKNMKIDSGRFARSPRSGERSDSEPEQENENKSENEDEEGEEEEIEKETTVYTLETKLKSSNRIVADGNPLNLLKIENGKANSTGSLEEWKGSPEKDSRRS